MKLFRRRHAAEGAPRKQTLVEVEEEGAGDLSVSESDLFQLRGPEGPDPFDTYVLAKAPGLEGDGMAFWSMPDGDLLVAEEGSADVSALAAAVEKELKRPYKALASRQERDLWAVGAKRIEVARFSFEGGDFLTLAHDEVTQLTVDEEPSQAPIPKELQAVGEQAGPTYYVEASRIRGDLWEVRADAL